ncbi:molybdate ABC transporter substrate-binding protein [Bowdeniella nasicola]|uniref:Molybdate ABC transporter substrate-binding protein n=2 Tax=Bowdeniella nasicola TaxID=208480 RepID=A0A1Q5Q1P8_9ACTO|nr:molybdate ABC transporter substrate-binding protein [Bowdeniella nasicola]
MLLSACGGAKDAPADGGTPADELTGEVTVFAAASLNKAFSDIGDELMKKNPKVKVKYSFEGSSTLVDQMSEGAPADVFASADEKNMKRATESDLVEDNKQFATNVLTLIVPAGNPAKITGLDASLDGKRLVVCAPGVPCGNATKTLAENLGVTLKPVSEEQKVTDVRGKVEAGEADAGLVYTTDAKAAGDKVEIIAIDGADKVVNKYPIALTKKGKDNKAAQAFIDMVLSAEGQKILADYGFGAGADAK